MGRFLPVLPVFGGFWWLSFLWVSLFLAVFGALCFRVLLIFGGFRGFFGVVFRGFVTSLDQKCHRDDIVRCSGWLITTADTMHVV